MPISDGAIIYMFLNNSSKKLKYGINILVGQAVVK